MLNQIDFIIKTFKRYECLNELLKSIKKFYPEAHIIVADDNSDAEFNLSFYRKWKNVEVVRLPFDSGLSAGRNAMVKYSKRPYILLLDDDFIFTKETDIDKFYKVMTSDKEIGVVGGCCLEAGQEVHYELIFELKNGVLTQNTDGNKWTERQGIKCKRTGCVLNFALFNKELFNCVQWDEKLKIVEHSDFYLQLQKYPFWKIYYTPEVKIIHKKVREASYKKWRLRTIEFLTKFFNKWGIKYQVDINGHYTAVRGNQIIKKYVGR